MSGSEESEYTEDRHGGKGRRYHAHCGLTRSPSSVLAPGPSFPRQGSDAEIEPLGISQVEGMLHGPKIVQKGGRQHVW